MADNHRTKSLVGERFESGSNWSKFLRILSEESRRVIEESLDKLLAVTDLMGKHSLGSYNNRHGCNAFVSLKSFIEYK